MSSQDEEGGDGGRDEKRVARRRMDARLSESESIARGLGATERLIDRLVENNADLRERVGERVSRLDERLTRMEERLAATQLDAVRLLQLVRDGGNGERALLTRVSALEDRFVEHLKDATERQEQLDALDVRLNAGSALELGAVHSQAGKRHDQRTDAGWKYATWVAIVLTGLACQAIWELVKERVRRGSPP